MKGNSWTLILALPPTSHVILLRSRERRTHHLSGSAASVKQEGLTNRDQIILKAPSSSNLLGSILSREPHLWGRGNRNILSAQIQPRHMPAQPHPAHLAWSCCQVGRALGTRLFPNPSPLAKATGVWLHSSWVVGEQEDRGRGWGRRGKGSLAGGT